ncbi:hypothetical protein [Sulfurimonas sp.]
MSNQDDVMQMCPVCGHDLKIIEDENGQYMVVCYYCDFEHGPFQSYEKAFEAWKKDKDNH